MVFIFFIAFFLDFFEIVFIVVPLLVPVAQALDIDLVWFGLLLCVNMQTSFMHPPFGFALFYLRGIAPKEVKSSDIYWGSIPWIVLQLMLVGDPDLLAGVGDLLDRRARRCSTRRRSTRRSRDSPMPERGGDLGPPTSSSTSDLELTNAATKRLQHGGLPMKRRNFLKVAAGGGAAADARGARPSPRRSRSCSGA